MLLESNAVLTFIWKSKINVTNNETRITPDGRLCASPEKNVWQRLLSNEKARDNNEDPERDNNGDPERDNNGDPERDNNGDPERDNNGDPERDNNGDPERDNERRPRLQTRTKLFKSSFLLMIMDVSGMAQKANWTIDAAV
eukprot:gene548-10233_t